MFNFSLSSKNVRFLNVICSALVVKNKTFDIVRHRSVLFVGLLFNDCKQRFLDSDSRKLTHLLSFHKFFTRRFSTKIVTGIKTTTREGIGVISKCMTASANKIHVRVIIFTAVGSSSILRIFHTSIIANCIHYVNTKIDIFIHRTKPEQNLNIFRTKREKLCLI